MNFLIASGDSTEYFQVTVSYRARESFLAVRYDQQVRVRFTTITAGAIIALQSEVHPSGLVSVLYNGQIVAVFMKDIESRADVVETSLAS
ncbi:MAG TPA: hypothetical protein VK776_14215 [Bryobacteraceae bacterium]|nr:hypothetical protein [Bryobacteraceae bacterium]